MGQIVAAGRPSPFPSRRVRCRWLPRSAGSWIGVLALLSSSLVAPPARAARVEIVLDASGSMRGAAGGASKMEAARQAVRTTVEAIDPGSLVALRLYGHRLPSEPKDPSCEDSELVIPFAPIDKQRFIAAVEAARPLGQTPLAYSLERAAADFGDLGDEAAAVILVSDGEESCGGDPAAVACAFAERGLELTIHTVGFDVDQAARQQLQAVATCTGGQYLDAKDAGELAESLQRLTRAGLLVEKRREELGRAVRGGDGFASAVPITPGTYHLDHHQRPGEYDYFTIDVAPGHVLRVSQEAYEVGVTIEGDTFEENTYPTAGVAIHGPDRERVGHQEVIQPGEKAEAGASVSAGTGGRAFILIGQDVWSSWGIHQSSPITIEILDQTDAGSGEADAVTLEPGDHRAWLQEGDASDVFAVRADPAATYGLRVRPAEAQNIVRATVTDEDGVELASGFSPNPGAAVRLEDIHPPRAGRIYLRIENIHPQATAYTLTLTAAGGSLAAAEAGPEAGPDEETAGDGGEPGEPSLLDRLPGGAAACGVLAVVAALVTLAIVVIVVILIRRRGRGGR